MKIENTVNDEEIGALLRVHAEKIREWYFTPGYPSGAITVGQNALKGEVIEHKAEGLIDFEGVLMPVSLHITTPVAASAIPMMGDDLVITIKRAPAEMD